MQTPISNPNPAVSSSLAAAAPIAFPNPVVPQSSLFVNDLHASVTESCLYETFSKCGPVATVKVCCDSVTRRSLGYGYVNFHHLEDATRALEMLNFNVINGTEGQGSPCRIMWSQRDPSFRKSGVGNVFVKNLDKTIDNKTLYDTFSAFGNILSAKVPMDEKLESKGYGFVQFSSEASAQNAIARVNGTELNSKKITVESYKNKILRGSADKAHFNNVYVKNLPPSFNDEQLKELFSRAGTISSVKSFLSVDPRTKVPKCFGFVCFEKSECASDSIKIFHTTIVGEEALYVCRAMKKSERLHSLKVRWEQMKEERFRAPPGSNLYVKNLAYEVTDENLSVDFGKFGAITSAKIMVDSKSKQSRGFGFVNFTTAEDASKALTHMNKMMYFGKPLIVCVAELIEIRRQRLAHQRDQLLKSPNTMYGQPFPMMQFPSGVIYPNMGFNNRGGPANFNGPDMYGNNYQQQRPTQQPMMNRNNYPQQPQQYMQQQGQPQQQYTRNNNFGNSRSGRGGAMMQQQPMHPQQQQQQQQQMQMQQQSLRPAAMPLGAARNSGARPNMVARPQTQPLQQQQQQQPMQQVGAQADANPFESQKQQIGEQIFPLIHAKHPELAGKITGMLLEMEQAELLQLCNSPALLDERIKEALDVLRQSGNINLP